MPSNPAILLQALIPAVLAAPAGGPMAFLASPQAQAIFPLILIFAGMYFLVIRPQQRRIREHQSTVSSLKRGDVVVLASGVIGKIVRVEEKEVGVEIAQNVTVKVVKGMISEVRSRGEPAVANDAKAPGR